MSQKNKTTIFSLAKLIFISIVLVSLILSVGNSLIENEVNSIDTETEILSLEEQKSQTEEELKQLEEEAKRVEIKTKIKHKEKEIIDLQSQLENNKVKATEDESAPASLRHKVSQPIRTIDDPAVAIKTKVDNLKPGNRVSQAYINQLIKACDNDIHAVRSIIAIAGHESSFGTKGRANDKIGEDVNFIGFFLGGNKNYDPKLEVFADVVCSRFTQPNKYYHGRIIDSKGNVDKRLAGIYSGNDRPITWANNVSYFYKKLL